MKDRLSASPAAERRTSQQQVSVTSRSAGIAVLAFSDLATLTHSKDFPVKYRFP